MKIVQILLTLSNIKIFLSIRVRFLKDLKFNPRLLIWSD